MPEVGDGGVVVVVVVVVTVLAMRRRWAAASHPSPLRQGCSIRCQSEGLSLYTTYATHEGGGDGAGDSVKSPPPRWSRGAMPSLAHHHQDDRGRGEKEGGGGQRSPRAREAYHAQATEKAKA